MSADPLRRYLEQSSALARAITSGEPVDRAPKGRALLRVLCETCRRHAATVEVHYGITCWRVRGRLYPFQHRPDVSCPTHGLLIAAVDLEHVDDDAWWSIPDPGDESATARVSPQVAAD